MLMERHQRAAILSSSSRGQWPACQILRRIIQPGQLKGLTPLHAGATDAAVCATTFVAAPGSRKVDAEVVTELRYARFVHGDEGPQQLDLRIGAFTHRSRDPEHVAKALGAEGIYVWSGHNYAYEVVRHLGIDEIAGVVRIGMAHYNTAEEIDRTLAAVRRSLA